MLNIDVAAADAVSSYARAIEKAERHTTGPDHPVRGIELRHAQRKRSAGSLFDKHRDLRAAFNVAYGALDSTVPLEPFRQIDEDSPDLVGWRPNLDTG
jgi:hypothetical protein